MDPANTTPVGEPHPYPGGCGVDNCSDCWWIRPAGWDPHEGPYGCGEADCVACWEKHAINAGDSARYWLGEHTAKLADDAAQLASKDPDDPAYAALDEALWVLQTCLRIWAQQDPRPPFYMPDPSRPFPWKAIRDEH
jgi:hypothetical protein